MGRAPLWSIHTMMSPVSSEVVSFRYSAFHVTHTTLPLWPSRVWFIERLEGAATPPLFAPCPVVNSICSTLRSPESPPHAIHPWSGFHDKLWRWMPLGMAIFLDK